MKKNWSILILPLLTAVLTGCAYDGPPVYGVGGTRPITVIEGDEDTEFSVGDMVTVSGTWCEGGTPGGCLRVLTIGDAVSGDGEILDARPITERAFYLNRTIELTDGFLTVNGMIIQDDLYAYGYVLENEEPVTARFDRVDETVILADLEIVAPRVRTINLDDITSDFHHQYNEGYEIKADRGAAEIHLAGYDFDNGYALYEVFLEQLPPYEDPRLYRSLDLYLIYDDESRLQYGVVCVGGYFLE